MNPFWPFREGLFQSLADNEVHVWKCPLTVGAEELARRIATLSPDEQDRARQFKMERPRDQFVIARSTLRALLGRYLDVAPETIVFELNEHGKPRLKAPSATLEFNVSHSHDLALFAFSKSTPVGVDVEWLGRELAHADIAKRFFSEREQAQLNEVPAADRHRAFLECWTRKEAYLKAHGSGLSRDTRTFTVSLVAESPAPLIEDQRDPAAVGLWRIHSFKPGIDYCGALAAQSVGSVAKTFF